MNNMNEIVDITNVLLETPRLILRCWNENDLNDFYEYASVAGVGEMAGWNHHKSIDETRKILNSFIEKRNTFAIVYKENNKVIGSLGIEEYKEALFPNLKELKGREIGYVLSKNYWGLGLMAEAVKEVIRYTFSKLGLDFLICGHFKNNNQSKRVVEKCLFKYALDSNLKTQRNTIEKVSYYVLYPNDFKEFMEKLTIFNSEGIDTNKWIYRGEEYSYNGYYGVADIICKNQNGKYLITRRDLNKRTHPGLWEVTGGAIQYKENPDYSAVRELKEETGIDGFNFKRIGIYLRKSAIYFTYYCECNCKEDYFVFQKGETIDYKWVTKAELISFFENGDCIPAQAERFSLIFDKI